MEGGGAPACGGGGEGGSGGAPQDTPRFLAPGEEVPERIALVSYPRSGNTLLRMLLERHTGIITGSDTRPNRRLSLQLQEAGLKGEGLVGKKVWVVKTHFPERRGWKRFAAQKIILLVRSPFDAIDSLFNMALTRTHTLSIMESEYARLRHEWESFVATEAVVWRRFHRYWLQLASPSPYSTGHTLASRPPLYIVRYEDLLRNAEETIASLMRFMYGDSIASERVLSCSAVPRTVSTIRHTNGIPAETIASREPTAASEPDRTPQRPQAEPNTRSAGAYKPRSGKILASLRHYSDEQMTRILTLLKRELVYFGYDEILNSALPAECPISSKYRALLGGHFQPIDEPITRTADLDLPGQGADDVAGDYETIVGAEVNTRACDGAHNTGGRFQHHNENWHIGLPTKLINVRVNIGTDSLRPVTPEDPYGRGLAWAKQHFDDVLIKDSTATEPAPPTNATDLRNDIQSEHQSAFSGDLP